MMHKFLLRSGFGAAALALSAVGLYAETIVPSVASSRCANGACTPRRLTNGYYPTVWRRWPVEPPAPEKPGVRESISAPGVELPSPNVEITLPRGVLIEPPPLEESGANEDFGPAPSERPTLPGPPTPRREPQEGMPPELRGEPSRFPTNREMPGRQRAIAGREVNRPAAVIEALRNEASLDAVDEIAPRTNSRIPAALPEHDGMAQPMPPPQALQTPAAKSAEAPTIVPRAGSISSSQAVPLENEQALRSDSAVSRQGRTNWSPTRSMHEDAVQPRSSISQVDTRSWIAPPEQTASRQPASGLNAPAAIYARTLAHDVRRSATRADFSISAPASPAVLAVRTVSDEGWNPNSQFRNPLRGASAVTKVAFESGEIPREESPIETAGQAARLPQREELALPDNPLR
jgi:hypothetical protein